MKIPSMLCLLLGALLCTHCQLSGDPLNTDGFHLGIACEGHGSDPNGIFTCGDGSSEEQAYVIADLEPTRCTLRDGVNDSAL